MNGQWFVLLASLLSTCQSASKQSGSAAAGSSSSAPSAEVSPSVARATPELIRELTGFPEALVAAEPKPLRAGAEALIEGKLVWSRVFRTKDGFEAFQVHVCTGPCEIPILERMKQQSSSFPLVHSRSVHLSERRNVEASVMTGGLGGALVASRAPTQNGVFTIVTIMNMPPGDIPVSAQARAFFQNAEPLDIALALGSGLDARL